MTQVSIGDRLPPGQHVPFATITDDDHRAWILITTTIGIAFGSVTLVTRIFIRWFGDLSWGMDDSMAVLATAFSIIQSSLVLAACSRGLGKSVDLVPIAFQDRVQQLYYASNFFFIFTLDISKMSSMLFFRRLISPGSRVRLYSLTTIVLLQVSTVTFLLATALQCNTRVPWMILDTRCSDWFLRWILQSAFSCIFELVIAAGPIWLIWSLQAPLATRIEAATPFALRLIIIPITIARLCSFDKPGSTFDPFLLEAPYICWTQTEQCYGVMAATFPSARRLIADLNTYYNSGRLGTSSVANDDNQSFPLSTLRSGVYQSQIAHAGRTSVAEDGVGITNSQELIIKRRVSIEVRHDKMSSYERQERSMDQRVLAGPS